MIAIKIPDRWKKSKLLTLFFENKEQNCDFLVRNAFQFYFGTIIPKKEYELTDDLIATYKKYTVVNTGDIVINGLNLNYDFVTQRVGMVKEKGIITSAYIALRARDNVNADYYCYLFKVLDAQKIFNGMGTGIRLTLSYKELKYLEVPVPPLAEQEAIVKFLDYKVSRIKKLILIRERQISELKELKKAVINKAVTKDDWKRVRLSSLFVENTNKNSEFSFSSAFQFYFGTIIPKKEYELTQDLIETYKKYTVIKVGDIVINGLNLNYDFVSQRVGLVEEDGIITSAYIALRPRVELNNKYYCYFLKSLDARKIFHGMGTGIRLTLSYKDLKNYPLPFPSLSEQNEIAKYLDKKCTQIDKLITIREKQITELNELKARLISDAVTGKIDVR